MTTACHGVKACVLDKRVAERVLTALQPAAVELSWQAAQDVARQREQLDAHWKQRLQQARYEASRAERQYDAAEPENRQVARRLETRWNDRLAELQRLEEDYARFSAEQPLPPSEEEHAALQRLSRDIPSLWASRELTSSERSEIVHCLLSRVEVRVQDGSERVDVTLHWQGGFVSQEEVRRPVGHYTQLSYYDELLSQVTEMWQSGRTANETAAALNVAGFRSARGACFSATMVNQLRRRCLTPAGEHEWLVSSLSRKLSLPETRLKDWLRRGWLRGEKLRGQWIAWADGEELERLRTLSAYAREHGRFTSYPAALTSPKRVPQR